MRPNRASPPRSTVARLGFVETVVPVRNLPPPLVAVMLLWSTLATACGDDTRTSSSGGAGGSEPSGAGGAGTSATSGTGDAAVAADRDALDACGLDQPCPAALTSNDQEATDESFSCLWTALAADEVAAQLAHHFPGDGCNPGECGIDSRLYVADRTAYLSRITGPLQRCTIRPPEFFQGCLDLAAAGENVPYSCSSFDEWLVVCADAEPACP